MIRLTTLGEVDLRGVQGERINSVLSQPGRFALLVYLAMAGGSPVRRDTLLGLFWPDSPEERARHRLSQAVYHLRRSLGRDAIHGRGEAGYGVSLEHIWCDAAEFERILDGGRTPEALELYGGDFLPGFFAESAPGFSEWMDRKRGQLRRAAAEAALGLSRDRLGRDPMSAAAMARRAMELAPGDEGMVRGIMEVLADAGDRLGALAAYEALEERLSRDFDAEPSRETTALAHELQEASNGVPGTETEAGEPSPPPRPPRPRWRWPVAAVMAAVAAVALLVQSPASPAGSAPVPRVFVQDVESHQDLGTGMDLARAVTTETLAQLADVVSFEVLPHDPVRAAASEPAVILRADLARSGDRVRITALLLDAESLVTIGRGSRELPMSEDLQLVDAAAAWLSRFTRERAGVWMRERQMYGSGATERTLTRIRSAITDRNQADSLAQVGSVEAAVTLLGIADSVLARAEVDAPGWAEPSIQRAETALARMWLALRQGGVDDPGMRQAVTEGLDHAERALSRAPDDLDALAVHTTLTYWLWQTTPADSAELGLERARRAEAQLRMLVERDPTRARAWTDLSAVLQARGSFAEARGAAERAFRADAYLDRTGSLTPRLFETALETGDLAAARHWCDEMAGRSNDPAVGRYCRLALLAWGPEAGPDQVEAAAEILAGLGDSQQTLARWGPQVHALMAVILARAGDHERATTLLERRFDSPFQAEAAPLRAWALLHMGAPEAARAVLEAYIAARPQTRAGLAESRRFRELHPVADFTTKAQSPG
jgi:DNA-binding SARP family transcriptional activator